MNGKGTEYIAEAVMERGRKMEKWKTPRPGKDREEMRRDEKRWRLTVMMPKNWR